MKNSKKILAGIMALVMTAGFSACSGGDGGSGSANNGGNGGDAEDTAAQQEVTTTTGVTVEVNTEGLKDDEQASLEDVMAQLPDKELENNEIKWMAHYDINPSTNGASKKPELEMFEQKYGGSIKWYETTYENRYNDLSTYVLGGEGIDFFASDLYNLPKGVVSGMFQAVDDYVDMNSAIWQNSKEAMECYNFGGKHYMMVTNVRANYYIHYNYDTLEANGLEDPWELYKSGEWNWDKFKEMLTDFVDEESDQWGLDNWYNETALLYSAGVASINAVDGNLVCNINDPTVEKAMNFEYDLFNSGLVKPMEQFGWGVNPEMMGEGRQLFWIEGYWGAEGDPDTWAIKIPPEKLGIVPTPSPAGSDPYQAATTEGYVLCKGATNPEGVELFAECTILAVNDERTIAIGDRKKMDDAKWSQDLVDREKEINALAKKYPVVELAYGVSTDVADYMMASAESCMKAAFHGTDWATTRETYADTIGMLVEEVNQELQKKAAE